MITPKDIIYTFICGILIGIGIIVITGAFAIMLLVE